MLHIHSSIRPKQYGNFFSLPISTSKSYALLALMSGKIVGPPSKQTSTFTTPPARLNISSDHSLTHCLR